MEPNTMSASVALYADTGQFIDPGFVRKASGQRADDDDDLLVGRATFGFTVFPPTPVRSLSKNLDFADRFNDQTNFDVRVCGVAGAVLPYLTRIGADQEDRVVSGLAVVEDLHACQGFDQMDVLSCGLDHLAMINCMGSNGLLWIHSARDSVNAIGHLHKIMAEQLRFRRKYPQWNTSTFATIAPLAGTMCGIVDPGFGQDVADDWNKTGCIYPVIDPDDEKYHDIAL